MPPLKEMTPVDHHYITVFQQINAHKPTIDETSIKELASDTQ
jgi:hypothetical protein